MTLSLIFSISHKKRQKEEEKNCFSDKTRKMYEYRDISEERVSLDRDSRERVEQIDRQVTSEVDVTEARGRLPVKLLERMGEGMDKGKTPTTIYCITSSSHHIKGGSI